MNTQDGKLYFVWTRESMEKLREEARPIIEARMQQMLAEVESERDA
jgi:hypothetical protein